MLDHLGLDVTDYDRSKAFYERALAPLGIGLVMEPVHGIGGFGESGKPYFWIGRRDRPPHTGVHVAFVASSREQVDAFHAAALAAGASDNGGPGVRETPTATTSRRSVTRRADPDSCAGALLIAATHHSRSGSIQDHVPARSCGAGAQRRFSPQ